MSKSMTRDTVRKIVEVVLPQGSELIDYLEFAISDRDLLPT